MTDWQDLLAERVRELEAGVNGYDRSLLVEKARAALRVLRVYEVRLRRVSLRAGMKYDGLQQR